MPATLEICESNDDDGEVIEHNIVNSNMGSIDAPNLNPVNNPIVPGENTFEKWQRFHVTDMGGSSQIENLKVWRTGVLGGDAVHVTNAGESTDYSYQETFTAPIVENSTIGTNTLPDGEPTNENLGIGGALGNGITEPGYSDYLIHQIQTNANDEAGSTTTMNYQYDEVA